MTAETLDAAVPTLRDADLVTLQALLPHLATKADVADLRADMERSRADLTAVQALLPHLATKADLADLRADQERLRAEIHAAMNALTWRLAGALLAGLTALAGLIVALQIFT